MGATSASARLSFFCQAEDGIRDYKVTGVQTCALPISTVAQEKFRPRPEVDPAAEVDGWLRTGEVQASRSARVWVSPERARWAREARQIGRASCRERV